MGFGLQFSSVNFGVGGLGNADQLVSPDHHLAHLKGVAFFLVSAILFCSDDLMIVTPHSMVAVANPLQLSLRTEAALA